jgi:hypothetical protein
MKTIFNSFCLLGKHWAAVGTAGLQARHHYSYWLLLVNAGDSAGEFSRSEANFPQPVKNSVTAAGNFTLRNSAHPLGYIPRTLFRQTS